MSVASVGCKVLFQLIGDALEIKENRRCQEEKKKGLSAGPGS